MCCGEVAQCPPPHNTHSVLRVVVLKGLAYFQRRLVGIPSVAHAASWKRCLMRSWFFHLPNRLIRIDCRPYSCFSLCATSSLTLLLKPVLPQSVDCPFVSYPTCSLPPHNLPPMFLISQLLLTPKCLLPTLFCIFPPGEDALHEEDPTALTPYVTSRLFHHP